jgi:hypothetical protein
MQGKTNDNSCIGWWEMDLVANAIVTKTLLTSTAITQARYFVLLWKSSLVFEPEKEN